MSMSQEYYDKEFEGIVERLPILMGQQESVARFQMGDAAYDKMVAYQDAISGLNLRVTSEKINHISAMNAIHQAIAFFLFCLPFLGLGWSIFYWVH